MLVNTTLHALQSYNEYVKYSGITKEDFSSVQCFLNENIAPCIRLSSGSFKLKLVLYKYFNVLYKAMLLLKK